MDLEVCHYGDAMMCTMALFFWSISETFCRKFSPREQSEVKPQVVYETNRLVGHVFFNIEPKPELRSAVTHRWVLSPRRDSEWQLSP